MNDNADYSPRETSILLESIKAFPDAQRRYRPPQTRYGAHVASQRCTILRSGKAIILCQNTQLMATPKTQIVLDMGYTLPFKLLTFKREDSTIMRA